MRAFTILISDHHSSLPLCFTWNIACQESSDPVVHLCRAFASIISVYFRFQFIISGKDIGLGSCKIESQVCITNCSSLIYRIIHSSLVVHFFMLISIPHSSSYLFKLSILHVKFHSLSRDFCSRIHLYSGFIDLLSDHRSASVACFTWNMQCQHMQ